MKNKNDDATQPTTQAQDNNTVAPYNQGEKETKPNEEKRSKFFAVNVQTPEANAAIHARINQVPGDTMCDKLMYCLDAGLETATLISQHQDVMRDIRMSHKRTEDIILGTLQKTNAANEDALAQKDRTIAALHNELGTLRKTISDQTNQISAMKIERANMEKKVKTLTDNLTAKDKLIAALQRQMETRAAENEQLAALTQRFSALEKLTNVLTKNIKGEQIAFPNLDGSRND